LKTSIIKRVERLEDAFHTGDPKDDWVDFCMWDVSGGVFGHSHYRLSKSRGEILRMPCSDEEEVAIMREHYECDGRRLYGKGSEVSFVDYLERFSYLGPEALSERRKSLIERVRSEIDGARVGDSSC